VGNCPCRANNEVVFKPWNRNRGEREGLDAKNRKKQKIRLEEGGERAAMLKPLPWQVRRKRVSLPGAGKGEGGILLGEKGSPRLDFPYHGTEPRVLKKEQHASCHALKRLF